MRSSSRQTLGGKRLKCRTTAWIAGLLVEDGASRLLPGNDEQKESKERKKKSEAKRRQTQCVFCRAVRARPRPHTGGAHLSAFHRGSCLGDRTPPLSFSPRYLGWGPVSGRYPQTDPSQYSEAPRRPVVVPVGRVPEAARERFQPNLTRAEAALRIAVLTAKLKLLDGPPHTL